MTTKTNLFTYWGAVPNGSPTTVTPDRLVPPYSFSLAHDNPKGNDGDIPYGDQPIYKGAFQNENPTTLKLEFSPETDHDKAGTANHVAVAFNWGEDVCDSKMVTQLPVPRVFSFRIRRSDGDEFQDFAKWYYEDSKVSVHGTGDNKLEKDVEEVKLLKELLCPVLVTNGKRRLKGWRTNCGEKAYYWVATEEDKVFYVLLSEPNELLVKCSHSDVNSEMELEISGELAKSADFRRVIEAIAIISDYGSLPPNNL